MRWCNGSCDCHPEAAGGVGAEGGAPEDGEGSPARECELKPVSHRLTYHSLEKSGIQFTFRHLAILRRPPQLRLRLRRSGSLRMTAVSTACRTFGRKKVPRENRRMRWTSYGDLRLYSTYILSNNSMTL